MRLSDFISTIAAYKSANQPIINTSPYQTATEAVAIRTVHKAKGLEYSHVFLVALDDTAWGNAGGNNNTLALPKNLSHIRHTGITEDERLRILFVAITRAKTNLYLTSSLADFAGKSYPALEYLEGIEDIDPIIHNEETLPLTSLQNHWSSAYAPANLPDLSLILKRKLENYRLTPTDLITFIDIVCPPLSTSNSSVHLSILPANNNSMVTSSTPL